jgi:dephospho-CoA kinase
MAFLRVGLTGGIACGKSVVRARFASRGVATLDADAVVHDLFAPGTDVTRSVARAFSAAVLAPDGSIDRRRLGDVVFADPDKRKSLEAIVHPAVYRAIDGFFAERARQGHRLAVVDAALMIETGSYKTYDRVVVVYCPPNTQRERLMARESLSHEEAERRIEAQMEAEKKKEFADYVIDTSGTMEETLERADEVLERLLSDAGAR